MRTPPPSEDLKHLAIVAGSAALAVAVTAAWSAAVAPPPPRVPVAATAVVADPAGPKALAAPLADRLHGTVTAADGRTFRGYLRWNRTGTAWSDVLDGSRERPRRITRSGARFGHLARVEPLVPRSARLTFKGGGTAVLFPRDGDVGPAFRSLVVEGPAGRVELRWDEVRAVDFEAAPPAPSTPAGRRLHGTLLTTSGLEVSGHVTWDDDEALTTDVLDGRDRQSAERAVPFGEIRSIRPEGSTSARVVLGSGEVLVLSGTNDVGSFNRGISVSDPDLGVVTVPWNRLRELRLDAPSAVPAARYDRFDGGRRLAGRVVTRAGDVVEGAIRWDDDESWTWEMLDGEMDGAAVQVEMAAVAAVTPHPGGARVELRDGRALDLSGTNDVGRWNRGLVVEDGQRVRHVDWADLRRVVFRGHGG